MGFKSAEKPVEAGEIGRLKWIGVLFSMLFLLILGRAFTFQVMQREIWTTKVQDLYRQHVQLYAKRGVIYDRSMNILAMDIPITSLAVDPGLIEDRIQFASVMAEVFGEQESQVIQWIDNNPGTSFLRIRSDVTKEQEERLSGSGIGGLIFFKERKRVRPYGNLALPVLGITNAAHEGVGGVEQTMNETLKGRDGWTILQRDALNRGFASPDYPAEEPQDGRQLVLTLDQVFQTIVEQELQQGIVQHGAKNGFAVLMDPFSGEILSLASIAARSEELSFAERLQNLCIQEAFEPGSIFKFVPMAAALEENIFEPNALVHCENGAFKLANHTIHDHEKAFAWLTLSQILEVSSNIGIAKVGRKVGDKLLYQYMQNFGFGTRSGIPLPGEAAGVLKPLYKWDELFTATASYGQGISVNCVQMAAAMCAVVNGGELVKPILVKSILDVEGKEIEKFEWQVIRRVITEQTSYELIDMLEKVVLQGSGNKARVDGVRVAGKTGTAQKSLPGYKGYYPGSHVASFLGFWPVEAPRFVLAVILDEPRIAYWGSESAAPVFRRIVSKIMGLPSISPDERKPLQKKTAIFASLEQGESARNEPAVHESPYHVPNLIGLSVREALQRLAFLGIEAQLDGNGVVIEQQPKPGKKIEPDTICRLKAR